MAERLLASSQSDDEQLPLAQARDLKGAPPTFDESFMDHHAGAIISDARFAVVELVANCWDAGATRVEIVWPAATGDLLSVLDNGVGMTKVDFQRRWMQLNYNRMDHQGDVVEFPGHTRKRHRKAFGRNGIGRHAMFCFADTYSVETLKERRQLVATVSRTRGHAPFVIHIESEKGRNDNKHGAKIWTEAQRRILPVQEVVELIGSRFVADPEFQITVNGEAVTLTDLEHIHETTELDVTGVGTVVIRRFDGELPGRTSAQSGVAWWTNRRMVGMPSWDAPDGPLLDARTAAGKRLLYIVEADRLASDVKADWSGYHASNAVNSVRQAVYDFVRENLSLTLDETRRVRKRDALQANRALLVDLPPASQEVVANFIEQVQVKSPTITARDLENAARVLAGLEQARSGYSLLERLGKLAPDDLDGLNSILTEWTVSDIKKVLGELRYRLRLIAQLELLVEKHTADELHDLQPLFERGLWIFGPEFESISFTSNQTLSTVVERFFGDAIVKAPKRRPDFVVLPDSSIGAYSSDSFDRNHEVSGLSSVVIVEIKRGGSTVSHPEKDQAIGYGRAIRNSGKVSRETAITCYVLGSDVAPEAEEDLREGTLAVLGKRYHDVLRQAHARTFNLLQKIESSDAVRVRDVELDSVVNPDQPSLWEPPRSGPAG